MTRRARARFDRWVRRNARHLRQTDRGCEETRDRGALLWFAAQTFPSRCRRRDFEYVPHLRASRILSVLIDEMCA